MKQEFLYMLYIGALKYLLSVLIYTKLTRTFCIKLSLFRNMCIHQKFQYIKVKVYCYILFIFYRFENINMNKLLIKSSDLEMLNMRKVWDDGRNDFGNVHEVKWKDLNRRTRLGLRGYAPVQTQYLENLCNKPTTGNPVKHIPFLPLYHFLKRQI